MVKIYDDWGRLVAAVLRREELRQIAAEHEHTDSSISSSSDDEETISASGSIVRSSFSRSKTKIPKVKIYGNLDRLLGEKVEMAGNHSRNLSNTTSGSLDSDLSSWLGEPFFQDDENPKLPESNSVTTNDDNRDMSLQRDNEETSSTTWSKDKDEVARNKIYVVGAKELLILMQRDSYWDWTTHADSRFSEVAVLHYGRFLDIRARMQTRKLSKSTVYAAYLVFKLTRWSKGLESTKAVLNIFSEESDRDAEEKAHIVHLQKGRGIQRGQIAVRRVDGWMEVEIGNFRVDGHDEAVEARILDRTSWKMGLIVEGIEFRPLCGETRIAYLSMSELIVWKDVDDDDHEMISNSGDLEEFPILDDGDTGIPDPSTVTAIRETEDTETEEIDVSLLQEFVSLTSVPGPDPITPAVLPHSQLKQKKLRTTTGAEGGLGSHSNDKVCSEADKFCPDWNLRNSSSLQDDGVGVEMMSKLLLPKDETLIASLSRNQLFSEGYDRLSEVVYYFHGMKKMIEQKERENDDLKQKLHKLELETQKALAAKDSELDDLKEMVKFLKSDIEKIQNHAEEVVKKSVDKIRKVEENLEKAEAKAAKAVENYKNSEELRVDKHKFASKAFALGFELCKKQVLEAEAGFDISRLDVKRL